MSTVAVTIILFGSILLMFALTAMSFVAGSMDAGYSKTIALILTVGLFSGIFLLVNNGHLY